jgi:hypothetical protein
MADAKEYQAQAAECVTSLIDDEWLATFALTGLRQPAYSDHVYKASSLAPEPSIETRCKGTRVRLGGIWDWRLGG